MKRLVLSMLAVFIITCLFGCSNTKTLQRLNEEVYVYEGLEIPSALGKPKLKADELREKKKKDAKDMADDINTYADALIFMLNKSSKGSDKKMFINSFITLLSNDYEDVDSLILYNTDKYDRDISYYLLSIKAKGKYYLLDPFSALDEKHQWLEGYDLEKGSFDSKEEMANAVNSSCPYDFIKSFYTPKDADGNTLSLTIKNNDIFYLDRSFYFLVDYGYPELSSSDIDSLIIEANNGNYSEVKKKITNVFDAFNFLKKYGFKSTGMNNIVTDSEYDGPDVGNIVYRDDRLVYTVSGVESLILKEGQCTSTSTLFKYLLDDDYEEFGYIEMWCESKESHDGFDGHAIVYLKNNGKYYIVSPSYYLAGDGAWEGNLDLWKGTETLEEGIQKMHDSYYPIGKQVMTIAFTYDGIYCIGSENGRDENCTVILPTGSDVKVCLGRKYDFVEPKHPTSQEHIIGVKIKNK